MPYIIITYHITVIHMSELLIQKKFSIIKCPFILLDKQQSEGKVTAVCRVSEMKSLDNCLKHNEVIMLTIDGITLFKRTST